MLFQIVSQRLVVDATVLASEQQEVDTPKRLARRDGGLGRGGDAVVDENNAVERSHMFNTIVQRLESIQMRDAFMPDAPQRIATDTSQKVGIRFGETIRSYLSEGRSMDQLTALPLAIAGWLRYLLGVDDKGCPMPLSSDPLLADLQAQLAGIELGRQETCGNKLQPILSNPVIFGSDLTACPLGEKITGFFLEEIRGPGAVRDTLRKYLNC